MNLVTVKQKWLNVVHVEEKQLLVFCHGSGIAFAGSG